MVSAPVSPRIGVGTWAWGNQFLWGYYPAPGAPRPALPAALERLPTPAGRLGQHRW